MKENNKNTPLPNLREFTDEEIEAITDEIYDLEIAGRESEAYELKKQLPIMAGIANVLKQDRGIEALIASGMNLSKAVKEYGLEWLEK